MGTILYGRFGVIEAITQSYMVDSREIATIHPGHEIFVGIESMKNQWHQSYHIRPCMFISLLVVQYKRLEGM